MQRLKTWIWKTTLSRVAAVAKPAEEGWAGASCHVQEHREILPLPWIRARPQGLELWFGVVFMFVKLTIMRKKLLLKHLWIEAGQSDKNDLSYWNLFSLSKLIQLYITSNWKQALLFFQIWLLLKHLYTALIEFFPLILRLWTTLVFMFSITQFVLCFVSLGFLVWGFCLEGVVWFGGRLPMDSLVYNWFYSTVLYKSCGLPSA